MCGVTVGWLVATSIGILVAGLGMNPGLARILDSVASFPGHWLCRLFEVKARYRYLFSGAVWGCVAGLVRLLRAPKRTEGTL